MSKNSNLLFSGLKIVAWIIFVGLCIEAGSYLVNFIFHLTTPASVDKLYQRIDLSALYERSKPVFYNLYGLILSVLILKAILFYHVVQLMQQLDLERPFNELVARQIKRISIFTLTIGLLSTISGEWTKRFMDTDPSTHQILDLWSDNEAFILMGAVIYMIATIFQKGVQLQHENDLTV